MLYIPASFKYIVFAPQKIPYSGGGLFATFIVMMCDKTFVNLQPKKKKEKRKHGGGACSTVSKQKREEKIPTAEMEFFNVDGKETRIY